MKTCRKWVDKTKMGDHIENIYERISTSESKQVISNPPHLNLFFKYNRVQTEIRFTLIA